MPRDRNDRVRPGALARAMLRLCERVRARTQAGTLWPPADAVAAWELRRALLDDPAIPDTPGAEPRRYVVTGYRGTWQVEMHGGTDRRGHPRTRPMVMRRTKDRELATWIVAVLNDALRLARRDLGARAEPATTDTTTPDE